MVLQDEEIAILNSLNWINKNITPGYTDNTKLVQTSLIMIGYDLGSSGADGYFGPVTEAAVKAFQRHHGLTVDGSVGPQTYYYISKAAD